MTRWTSVIRLATPVCALGLVAYSVAARAAIMQPRAWFAAALGAAVLVASLAGAGLALHGLAQRRAARRAAGEAAFLAGIAAIAASGLLNWALDFRALLILTEGERILLGPEQHFRALSVGPFGRVAAPEGMLRLVKVDLVAAPGGGFLPRSDLVFVPSGSRSGRSLVLEPGQGKEMGATVVHQGAFGFVPRIIVHHGGETVLDTYVPLESRREAGAGIAFGGTIPLDEKGMALDVAIDMSRLDERMKGHPVVGVELRRAGELVGAGELLPGHGATMRDGWRVGFAGMKRWSEIDIATRSFRGLALAGGALATCGALLWSVSRLMDLRRRASSGRDGREAAHG